MGVIPDVVVELKANIDNFRVGMAQAHTDVEKLSKHGADNMEKLATVGQAAFVGLAGAAVAFGGIAIKEALQQEEANARLTTALHNAGSALTAKSKQMEEAQKASIRLGFADDDAADALAKLVNATHSSEQATKDLALAREVARGRNIDLSAATDILVKVETGHVAMLGKIGIDTKDATGKTISQEEAVRRLSSLYGGQASAYADTFAGKMAVLKAQTQDMAEQVGTFLIPKIEQLMTVGSGAIKWAQDHKVAVEALAGVIGGALATAMAVYIAKQTAALAMKVVDFFVSAAQSVGRFVESLRTAAVAEEAASGSMSLMVGGMGLAITALGLLTIGMQQNEAKARQWASNMAAAAGDPKDAIRKLTDEADRLQAQLDKHGAVAHIPFARMAVGAQDTENKITSLRAEAARLTAQQEGLQHQTEKNTGALGDLNDKADTGTTKLTAYQTAVNTLRDAMASGEEKAKAFKTAMDSLIGAPISAEKAKIGYLNSVQSLGDALAKNGSDFDLGTGAGRANRTALEAAVDAARTQLSAMQSGGAGPADLQAAFNSQRTGLINTLRSYGYGDRDVNNILAQEGFSPDDFNKLLNVSSPTFLAGQAGSAAAANAMQAYRGLYNSGALARQPTPGTLEGFMGPVADRSAPIQLIVDGRVLGEITQTQLLQQGRNAARIGLS